MKLLPVHKKLLTALGLVLVAWGVAYYFLIMPQKQELDGIHGLNEGLKADLRIARVTEFDPRKLTIYRDNLHMHKIKLNRRFQEVYARAMDPESRIGKHMDDYININALKRTVNTIAYQEAFLKLKNNLAHEGINLDEQILGLNEDSVDPNTYRLMAHLWMIEDLAALAKKHNLELNAPNDDVYVQLGMTRPTEPGRRPARIRALGVIVYRANPDAPAYMEEYPVRLRVTGSMQDVSAFLLNLTSDDYFMPLSEIAIMRTDINKWRQDHVEATLVCSGFLIMNSDLEKLLPIPIDTSQHNVPPVHRGG